VPDVLAVEEAPLPSGRRSRVVRQQKRAELGPERVEQLANLERMRRLRLQELRVKFEPRIVAIERAYAEERRKVNADFDERIAMTRRATILGPKARSG